MAKKPKSARAIERAALQEKFGNMSFAKMSDLLESGKVKISDIRKYYTDARSKAVKRVARVMKSDVPFVDAAPDFKKTSQLSDADLLKEVADVNKFLRGETFGATTVPERREIKKKAIETLKKRGYTFINNNNFQDWARFQKWMRSVGISAEYDSDSPTLVNVFKQAQKEKNNSSQRWSELFNEYRQTRQRKRRGKRKGR